MMKLEGLAVFSAVAEAGSVSEAARRLGPSWKLEITVVEVVRCRCPSGINSSLLNLLAEKA